MVDLERQFCGTLCARIGLPLSHQLQALPPDAGQILRHTGLRQGSIGRVFHMHYYSDLARQHTRRLADSIADAV